MQTTLKTDFSLVGTGLHSGRAVRLCVKPAQANIGIQFRRVEITDRDNMVPARFDMVNDTRLCTRLGNSEGVEISTVEHLMAAFAGCGIYNAIVEVDGPELPIMDGSSARFVREILAAGIVNLSEPTKVLRILENVSVTEGDVTVELSPSSELEIDFEIDFDAKAIGKQRHEMILKNGNFARELSNCRTFCLKDDVENMQKVGLALGGSLDNAVVVDGDKVLNPAGFRRDNECVRHKMLDAVGDLALAGMPVLGKYKGVRAGHRMTNLLLRAVFAKPESFEIVEADAEMSAKLPGDGLTFDDLDLAV